MTARTNVDTTMMRRTVFTSSVLRAASNRYFDGRGTLGSFFFPQRIGRVAASMRQGGPVRYRRSCWSVAPLEERQSQVGGSGDDLANPLDAALERLDAGAHRGDLNSLLMT